QVEASKPEDGGKENNTPVEANREQAARVTRSNTHVRKTKRGGVIKVVKELYLRDDVGCGLPGCAKCAKFNTNATLQKHASLVSLSTKHKTPHYLVPDTNVFVHQ
ncbi:exosome catalytic subunit dis3, partial [Rhizoclosmatium hyalinum]